MSQAPQEGEAPLPANKYPNDSKEQLDICENKFSSSQRKKAKHAHSSPREFDVYFKIGSNDDSNIYIELLTFSDDRMLYVHLLLKILDPALGNNVIIFPPYSNHCLNLFKIFDKNGNKIDHNDIIYNGTFVDNWTGKSPDNWLLIEFDREGIEAVATRYDLDTTSDGGFIALRTIQQRNQQLFSVTVPDLFVDNVKTDAVDLLHDMLCKLARSIGWHHHCLFLIQSSGYGKTKACITLIRRLRRAIYLVCNTNDNDTDKGFDMTPCVGQFMKQMEDLVETSDRNELAAEFIYKVCIHADKQETDNLYDQQFEDGAMSLEFSRGIEETALTAVDVEILTKCLYPYNPTLSYSSSWQPFMHLRNNEVIISPALECGAQSTGRSSTTKRSDDEKHDESVDETRTLNDFFVIIFDEAMGLMNSESQSSRDITSAYRCLRHMLDKVVVNGRRVIGIFISTSTNLPQLIHTSAAKDSIREEKSFYDVMYDFVHTGMYRDMLHRDSVCSFFIGRPLWYNKYLFNGKSLKTTLQLAMKMLCNKPHNEYKSTTVRFCGDVVVCDSALFMCRTAISSSQSHGSELIAHHLATLQNVHLTESGENEVVFQCGYVPEPILSEASILLTHGMAEHDEFEFSLKVSENFLSAHLRAINRNIVSQLLSPSKSDLSEVVGAATLIYTMDYIRLMSQNSYNIDGGVHCSTDVSVIDFLMALTTRFKSRRELLAFDGYYCNFTHFVSVGPNVNFTVKVLHSARLQNCAFYAKTQAIPVGGLIPIYRKDDRGGLLTASYSCLKVQFMNCAQNETIYQFELASVFERLNDSESMPDLEIGGGNPHVLGVIVIDVGKAKFATDYNHIFVTSKDQETGEVCKALNLTLGLCREHDFHILPNRVRHELVRIASIDMPIQVEQSLRVLNGSLIADNHTD